MLRDEFNLVHLGPIFLDEAIHNKSTPAHNKLITQEEMSYMKRIKVGIALITMCGLLLGTAGVASAKTTTPVHHVKVSQISTKITHHQPKSHVSMKLVHKTVRKTIHKTAKLVKTTKTTAKTLVNTLHGMPK